MGLLPDTLIVHNEAVNWGKMRTIMKFAITTPAKKCPCSDIIANINTLSGLRVNETMSLIDNSFISITLISLIGQGDPEPPHIAITPS